MKKRLKKKRKTYMINDVIDGIVDTMTVADHSTIIFTVDHTLVRAGSFHNKTLRYIVQKLKQGHDIDSVVVMDNAVKVTLAEDDEIHDKKVCGDVDESE